MQIYEKLFFIIIKVQNRLHSLKASEQKVSSSAISCPLHFLQSHLHTHPQPSLCSLCFTEEYLRTPHFMTILSLYFKLSPFQQLLLKGFQIIPVHTRPLEPFVDFLLYRYLRNHHPDTQHLTLDSITLLQSLLKALYRDCFL